MGVSISAHKNKVVIGPRDNGFPGPAAALDGPMHGPTLSDEWMTFMVGILAAAAVIVDLSAVKG